MTSPIFKHLKSILFFVFYLSLSQNGFTQERKVPNLFWSKVQFGGNIGLGFSDGGFNAVLAPAAIYNFNKEFALGTGLNFGYSTDRNRAEDKKIRSINYGISILSLYNPIPNLQLSAEFEEMGISQTIEISDEKFTDDYWYPALFIGAGYRINGMVFGLRYDVLYDKDQSIYNSAYAPFVRIFL